MPNPDGTKTDEEKREYWAVQQAKEVIQHVSWSHPAAIARLESFEISTDEYQAFAAQLLHEVKAEWSDVEDKRKAITKPLTEAHKATQAVFKPVLTALETAEKILKDKIAGYMQLKQQANVAALQAASQAPTALAASQAIDVYAPVAPPQGVSVRYVQKFVVEEPDLVPRDLCSPDEKKIGLALSAGREVPGVRVFEEPVVTARKA